MGTANGISDKFVKIQAWESKASVDMAPVKLQTLEKCALNAGPIGLHSQCHIFICLYNEIEQISAKMLEISTIASHLLRSSPGELRNITS